MNEALLERWSEEFLEQFQRPTALLLGQAPPMDLGFRYVQRDFTAVVIGSMTIAQVLQQDLPYSALFRGLPTYLVQSGLEHRQIFCANRLLWHRLMEAERQMQLLGIRFVGGEWITARDVEQLHKLGQKPPENCHITPLARDILEDLL